MRHRHILAAVAAICVLPTVQSALAHAVVTDSTPAAGAVVQGPALAVRIAFNSRIDAKRSRLQLVLLDGQARTLAIAAETSAHELRAAIDGLAPGAYKLRWQVLAVDGHITRGDILFRVEAR